MTAKSDTIRRLNDLARYNPASVNAQWAMTPRVASLLTDNAAPDPRAATLARTQRLYAAIASYSDFPEGGDPYREHDFGSFELFGEKLFWRIDLYEDTSVKSKNDPSSVKRVLTVMLAEEY